MGLLAMTWVKGQSGNPDGRAAEKPMRDAIELELAQEQDAKDFDGEVRKLRRLRLVARALVNKAVDGDVTAIKDVIDRMDGKPPQQINGAAPDGAHNFIVRLIHEGKPRGEK
jgi:hypothetical protein